MAPISNTERKCRYLAKLKLRKPQFDQGKRQPMGKNEEERRNHLD